MRKFAVIFMCLVAGGFVQASCSLGDCALNESCELPTEASTKNCCSDPVKKADPIDCFCCELEDSHEYDLIAVLGSHKVKQMVAPADIAIDDRQLLFSSSFAKTVPKPPVHHGGGTPALKERLARLQILLI